MKCFFFLLCRYCGPLLIVCITLGISYATGNDSAYIHDGGSAQGDLCWLQEKTFIWAFVAPAGGIIAMNMFIMVKCLMVTTRARAKIKDCLLYTSPSPRD